jgi:hypothetical protein
LFAQSLHGLTCGLLRFRDGFLVRRQAGSQTRFQVLNLGAQRGIGHATGGRSRIGAAGSHRKELELHDDLLHALPTRRRGLGHAAGHQPVYRGTAGSRRGGIRQRQRERGLTVAIECAASGKHFEHQRAEREDVAACVGGLALQQFRGGVRRDRRRRPQRRNQIQTGSGHGNTGRGDRSMGFAGVVHLSQRVRKAHGIMKRFRDWDSPFSHALR